MKQVQSRVSVDHLDVLYTLYEALLHEVGVNKREC